MRSLCKLVLLSCCLFLLRSATAAELVVVGSDQGSAGSEFLVALEQNLAGSGWNVRGVGIAAAREVRQTDLLVTLGSDAAQSVLQDDAGPPVLALLLTRQAFEQAIQQGRPRGRGLASAIYLDQPYARQASFIAHLLPERRRVAVVVGAAMLDQISLLRRAAAGVELDIRSRQIERDEDIVPALGDLLPHADLLLALPDNAVFRRDNARTILLTTYRYQKPLIAFSPAYVSAGALAALYSTPAQLARQTAELVRALPAGRVSLPPPRNPAYFSVATNPNVARALNIDLPDPGSVERALASDKEIR
jgi:putative tryptophan/tyrosine transport system substrate-binding protein